MQIHKVQIISKSSSLRTWIEWYSFRGVIQEYLGWSSSSVEPDTLIAGLELQFLLNIILWFPVELEWWILLPLWFYCYQSICVGSLWWEADREVEQQIALGAQAKDTFCFQSIWKPYLVFFMTEFSISRALSRGLMSFCKISVVHSYSCSLPVFSLSIREQPLAVCGGINQWVTLAQHFFIHRTCHDVCCFTTESITERISA